MATEQELESLMSTMQTVYSDMLKTRANGFQNTFLSHSMQDYEL